MRNPDLGNHVNPFEGRKRQADEVGKDLARFGRVGEFVRILAMLVVFAKAERNPGGLGAQPVGGVEAQRRRDAPAQLKLPDLVVDVVGWNQPCIASKREAQRVAGLEVPFAHNDILCHDR
ncbi:MAG: hypothetical protein M5U05_12395 [Anaerolineales bacterium]|nr:hypothetical protein [Anaerolineales bacterium]